MQFIPFTSSGYEELKQKLNQELDKRPNAVSTLKRAREMGDLSENGLYKAARMELSQIDREIRFLKNLIKYGKPSIPTDMNTAQFGCSVVITGDNGKREYQIVGEYEANPREGKVSYKSPIGHNILGKKLNDKIYIKTPKGEISYIIEKIF